MSKLYNEDGEEIEAFTKEELDAQLKDAISAKEEEKKTLESKIEELSSKIDTDDKDTNFKALREAKEAKEKQLEEVMSKISKIESELNSEKVDKLIYNEVGRDSELAQKVKYHYDKMITPKEGEEDTRLKDAMILATGGKTSMDTKMFSSGKGDVIHSNGDNKLNTNQVELAKKLGLSDDDIKGK